MGDSNNSEKRSYFRIKHDILLEYHVVDAKTASESDANDCFGDSQALEIFADFRQIDHDAAPILQEIASKDREVAEYLQLINRKFDLLAQNFSASSGKASSQKAARVDMSEGGIAFRSNKAIYSGSLIAVRVIFLPSYAGVSLFAKVVRCDSDSNGQQIIAAKFLKLSTAKREVIGREIMRTQQKIARAKKQAQERAK